MNQALKEMNAPFYNANDFINRQIDEVLEKYERRLEEKEEYENQKVKRRIR